jgi:hypothetical protein
MSRPPLRRRKRDESGVVAILVGVLALLIMMFAAYAVDIGMQVNRKHQLEDTLDAAAQAGAFDLPGSSVTAKADALAFATAHDGTETGTLAPNVDFWCVVASKGPAPFTVDTTQIPSTCYPGAAPYAVGANYKATGLKVACSAVLCAIPCVEPSPNTGTPKIACNTIRVYQGRTVPFAFAPAGGIMQGSTGNIISVACKGSCGTIAPNPLDVAVVADRTGSMSGTDVDSMITGIKGMLQQMTPSQQYVALGTIGRASTGSTPSSEPGASCPSSPSSSDSSGTWIPVPFSNNYLSGTGTNASSGLVKGVNCLTSQSSTGTALAAPMKAAARYLLGNATNNLSSLPTRQDPASKVLIFETDGQPNESPATGGTTALTDGTDIFSNTDNVLTSGPVTTGPVTTAPTTPYPTKTRNSTSPVKTWNDIYKTTYVTTTKTTTKTQNGGQTACSNVNDVAANAKAAGILVITIAYNLGGNHCGESNPSLPSSTSNTSDATPVVTSIAPAAADTNGNKVVDANYQGNATVNQTVNRTITNVNWNESFDALVTNTLAGAASNSQAGLASDADNTCVTTAEQVAENSDGDYFFCAASGTDMAPIFRTALSQASKGIKLIKMPS